MVRIDMRTSRYVVDLRVVLDDMLQVMLVSIKIMSLPVTPILVTTVIDCSRKWKRDREVKETRALDTAKRGDRSSIRKNSARGQDQTNHYFVE